MSIDAVRSLLGAGEARHLTVGLVLAAVSLASCRCCPTRNVEPVEYWDRRRRWRLETDPAVPYLSAVLLVGLSLNSLFGWSWADPIAALVIAGIAVKEASTPRAETLCCTPAGGSHPEGHESQMAGGGCGPGCSGDCCSDRPTA